MIIFGYTLCRRWSWWPSGFISTSKAEMSRHVYLRTKMSDSRMPNSPPEDTSPDICINPDALSEPGFVRNNSLICLNGKPQRASVLHVRLGDHFPPSSTPAFSRARRRTAGPRRRVLPVLPRAREKAGVEDGGKWSSSLT